MGSEGVLAKITMLKVLLLACMSMLVMSSSEEVFDQFVQFTQQYGKTYRTRTETSMRASIFQKNLKKIEEHNKSGSSWKMGVNEFTDMTEAEFQAIYTGGYKRLPGNGLGNVGSVKAKAAKDLPASVDWRNNNTISAVKNQGHCGSCWAFCTAEMIESYAAIATGNLLELSTQQVTSCTPNPLSCGGTGGCSGSIPQLGYTYLQLFGHVTEEAYPYVSGSNGDTGDCMYDLENATPVIGITGYNTLPSNDQEAVMTHLAEVGPLAVTVDASSWGLYSSGVFDGCSFDSNIQLNHAVQLVGYGTDASEGDYWIVRNSWGDHYGENGYIRLKRQSTAQCGTDSTPMAGTACEGGPGSDEQHVCGQCGVLFDTSYPLGAHEFSLP